MIVGGQRTRSVHWIEAFGFSAVLHLGAATLMFGLVGPIDFSLPDIHTGPELVVTNLTLDQATLAAVQAAPDQATADQPLPDAVDPTAADTVDPNAPDTVDPATADTLDPATTDTADPNAADTIDVASADTVDPVQPDAAPEPVTPDPVAPEPVTPEPVAPEPVTPDPVAPEPVTPEPVAPEPVTPDPVVPEPVTPDPVLPEPTTPTNVTPDPTPLSPIIPDTNVATISPIQPQGTAGVARVAPLSAATVDRLTANTAPPSIGPTEPGTTAAPERLAPRQLASAAAPPRAAAPAPPSTPESRAVAELIQRIRGRLNDPCLVAIPRIGADGAPEMAILAVSDSDIQAFSSDVLVNVQPPPAQRAVLVDPRQCAALTFVRENAAYPAFRLSAQLQSTVIASGDHLIGQIGGSGGRYVSLLLIDDNGVVQDIGTYLRFAGGQAQFDVPMRRSSNSRDTSQLLLAVATDARPRAVDEANGQLAEDFFASLRKELDRSSALVLIPFDVR